MKRENILFVIVSLVVGVLGGYLIFSISNAGKAQQQMPAITPGAGSPTDYTRRITEAEKLVAQDPKNLQAWISLGNDYFDTDQPQKSVDAYSKALELDSRNVNVLTDQGVMYRRLGWFDKALVNFEKAHNLDPNHLQSLFNICIVHLTDMKDKDKAAPYIARYLKLDPNSPNAAQLKGMQSDGGGAPAMK